MRLFVLVSVVMCAFAGNSILTRLGVARYGIDPLTFGAIRVAAGAAALLVLRRGRAVPLRGMRRWVGAGTLAVYMIGFSWAYLNLAAGLGALILFATVQGVMFATALWRGQAVPPLRWAGMALALGGLVVLLWPAGQVRVDPAGALAMICAGVGWGAYTLLGQGERDATAATTANFLLCLPLMALSVVLHGDPGSLSWTGVAVAALAGAVTSGLGYALWYRVLPSLTVTAAAVAQLSVPVIAVAGGIVLLSEPLTPRILLAAVMVLGGIGLSSLRQRRIGSNGS
ncbi:DMT family transporter [Loktanella sp. M215]|uniref:DMT family transporter n=1 Tax=Loktanella sp. M215 TaxID=2675431 RepID=UPI001F35A1E2|nr:DMT family transporter [Loktanella sp. M215]MCF7699443.1 EamA family transporter [Loktanella sp. M215]